MTELTEIPPLLRDVLRGIGLENPDLTVPLHRRLVEALHDLGPGATLGQRVVAMRWVFNWELRDAGAEFARAKAAYEHYMDRRMVTLLAEPKMSVAKAQVIASGDDEAYRLKLTYLLAEQTERAMRKFLETLDAALENHRTDRADQRAGDRAHAGGYTGGA